jgi:uncharacterized protein
MAHPTEILDLSRLGLASGEGRGLDLLVGIDPLALGGERYTAGPAAVPARLDVARTTGGGYSLRLRYELTLSGPCMRCLEAAKPRFTIDAREVDQPGGGDELDSPYLHGDELDVHAWARDALALELPSQIVCRDECLGICAICGENLNAAGPDHRHERAPDPRWGKLRELRLE